MVFKSSRERKEHAGVSRLEGRDWLPPIILLGDEHYRLKALRPLFWEENV